MHPFLLLATRVEDPIADNEYEAIVRLAGLQQTQLDRVRVEQGPLPDINLQDYSGVLVGGSPFNSSDPDKSELQQRVEADLFRLLDEIVARDFPFLGMCYGVGTLGTHQGGLVDRTFGEPVSAPLITLTDQGRADPLTHGLPETFRAFVGHKEAIARVPDNAVVLATGEACPVQMFRIKQNLYATQFHPELDADGLSARVEHYRYEGYFEPEEVAGLQAFARRTAVPHAPVVLRNFVRRYAR